MVPQPEPLTLPPSALQGTAGVSHPAGAEVADAAPAGLPIQSTLLSGRATGARWIAALRAIVLASLLAVGAVAAAPALADAPAAVAGAARAAAIAGLYDALEWTNPPAGAVDAVAVHGGGGEGMQRERPAADMVASGRAGLVVALGGPLPPADPDRSYAGAVVRRLARLNLPEGSVLALAQGGSTAEELRALRLLAEERGWREVALSTSRWHTRRVAVEAARVFAGSEVSLRVIALPTDEFDRQGWWDDPHARRHLLTEWAKLLLTALRPA